MLKTLPDHICPRIPASVMDINGHDHYGDAASDSGNDSINGAGVIENQVDSEDSASASDVSSSITQLDSDDFERYFTERNDRLFHSHGNSPYPLPVDTLEQEVHQNCSCDFSEQD